jgi:hypothetical protein
MMAVQTNLSRKAMLAVLSISRWTARKHDKKVSQDVKERNGANGNVGRYHKRLLPGDSAALDRVRKAADAARDFHYTNTLPWGQDGSRVLPKENYFQYTAKMRELRREFQEAVREFINEYPELQRGARTFLGTMFQEEDYPAVAQLEKKFGFDITFLPFPDAADFRVSLDADEEAAIRDAIDEQTNQAVQMAMRDIWTRLHDGVAKMVERLSDPDAVFRNTLVTNLRDLCALLPRLNVAGDQQLSDMCEQVKSKLAGYDPEVLRESPAIRAKAAMDAEAIADMMRAYMA